MATVSEEIAKEIIDNDGYYSDDPRVTKVVTYNNAFNGSISWAIIYGNEDQMRYENSPACRNVRVVWEAKGERRIWDRQPSDDRRGRPVEDE